MAIVNITQAARLVRRGRASIYRDIDKGLVSKSVSPTGEVGIDTAELLRAYGRLHLDEAADAIPNGSAASANVSAVPRASGVDGFQSLGDGTHQAVLEERLRALEQRNELLLEMVKLEQAVRRESAENWRARLSDKEVFISSLQNQILMLEYKPKADGEQPPARKSWMKRLFGLN